MSEELKKEEKEVKEVKEVKEEKANLKSEDTMMAMLAHLLAIPGAFIAPLVIYLIKKDDSEFIEDQAKEALNFQITMFIVALGGIAITIASCGYGGIIMAPIGILNMVFCILAGIKANDGEKYRYPFNIRIIK